MADVNGIGAYSTIKLNTGTGVSFVLADQAEDVRRMAGDLGLVREFEVSHGGRVKKADSRPSRPTQRRSRGGKRRR